MSDVTPLSLPLRWSRWRLHLGLAASGPLLVAVYFAAIALSGPLLDTGGVVGKTDVMVVLGGDGPARADRALELWRQQITSQILVTGDGDCTSIKAALVLGGVPEGAVLTECQSRNTWQNAEFSAPILSSLGVHSAVIVTNWFHARRALASFQAMCPGVSFIVASVPAPSFSAIATGPYGPAVAGEYIKTAWYGLGLWLRSFTVNPAPPLRASEVPQWTPC